MRSSQSSAARLARPEEHHGPRASRALRLRSSPALPDVRLVRQARNGDRIAYRALYESHAGLVHAILVSWVPPQEADDLMQETFLAAWRGLGSLKEDTQVGGWLAGIARNLARQHHRRAHRVESLPEGLQDPQRDEGAEILRILRTLPEAYRETLAMRLVEGMTGQEIASSTGLTPGSVRVNLSRGMKLLRERLRQEGWS